MSNLEVIGKSNFNLILRTKHKNVGNLSKLKRLTFIKKDTGQDILWV